MTAKEAFYEICNFHSIGMKTLINQKDPEKRTKLLKKSKKGLIKIVENKTKLIEKKEKKFVKKIKEAANDFIETLDALDNPTLNNKDFIIKLFEIMDTRKKERCR